MSARETRHTPDKEAIDALPPFPALDATRIILVRSAAEARAAAALLFTQRLWGFDTESKPTFFKDQVSDGPHVVQLAVAEQAWVFQLTDPACRATVAELLAHPAHTKAGFGLRDDNLRIRAKLGVEPAGVLDLNSVFREQGYRKDMGVRAAVAVLFGQRFAKSKKAATSNWAAPALGESQLLYAANDAWAAHQVAQALGLG
jgi:ribonuclease D